MVDLKAFDNFLKRLYIKKKDDYNLLYGKKRVINPHRIASHR